MINCELIAELYAQDEDTEEEKKKRAKRGKWGADGC